MATLTCFEACIKDPQGSPVDVNFEVRPLLLPCVALVAAQLHQEASEGVLGSTRGGGRLCYPLDWAWHRAMITGGLSSGLFADGALFGSARVLTACVHGRRGR